MLDLRNILQQQLKEIPVNVLRGLDCHNKCRLTLKGGARLFIVSDYSKRNKVLQSGKG